MADCAGPNAISNLARSMANVGLQDQSILNPGLAGLQKPGGPGGLTMDRTGLVDAHRPNEFVHPSAAPRHVQPRLAPQRANHNDAFEKAFRAPSASRQVRPPQHAVSGRPAAAAMANEFLSQQASHVQGPVSAAPRSHASVMHQPASHVSPQFSQPMGMHMSSMYMGPQQFAPNAAFAAAHSQPSYDWSNSTVFSEAEASSTSAEVTELQTSSALSASDEKSETFDWADALSRQRPDWESQLEDFNWEDYMNKMYDAKWSNAYESDGIRIEEENPDYAFQENNAYMDESNPFERGLRLMKEGNLAEAILAFEAAVKKEPEHVEAWKFLGQCCAENENEQGAISALLKCISMDPYNLDALLMTGVSFTNELDQSRALEYLQSWLTHHPDYAHLSEGAEQKEFEDAYGGSQHDRVTAMFLRALNSHPHDGDINVVLGVLFNLTNEYDRAAEFFRSALQTKKDDPSLWNKLGATLANGNHCAEAIEAYRRALALRPNYVRALSNLGISFSNQNMHKEACQSYVAALEMNPEASHVWGLLRLSIHRSSKSDLLPMAEKRDISALKSALSM